VTMPSDGQSRPGLFDRFADAASRFVSRAWFFAGCVALVLIWAPSILLIHTVDTWQLIINTVTTIITFVLVALLQNTQTRADAAVQQKLNAIADALSRLVEGDACHELRQAVGLEERESSAPERT
jgi:low affinity Fe/Cu permease